MKVNRQAGIHLHKTIAPNYYTGKHEWYWVLIARNGKTIARSSETYTRKSGAVKSMKIARSIFVNLGGDCYYDHTSKTGNEMVVF